MALLSATTVNRRPLCTTRMQLRDPRLQDMQPGLSYKPGLLDNIFLAAFRRKMVQMATWDSEMPGYDGLIDISRHLMSKYKNKLETEQVAVEIIRSLFPPFLLPLFRLLIAPLLHGKLAAIMTAKITQATCQWLLGPCTVNTVQLANGDSIPGGVFVERCKYLEESKCVGICTHICKLPTQRFMKQHMGIPLHMEPNFEDFSCQFKFGVDPPLAPLDEVFNSPCLKLCPNQNKTSMKCHQIGSPLIKSPL